METQIDTGRTLSLLDQLIDLNTARLAAYKLAGQEETPPSMKTFFDSKSKESFVFLARLLMERIGLGGFQENPIPLTEKYWQSKKNLRTEGKNDSEAVIRLCEEADEALLNIYRDAQKVTFPIPVNIFDVILSQKQMLEESYTRSRTLSSANEF